MSGRPFTESDDIPLEDFDDDMEQQAPARINLHLTDSFYGSLGVDTPVRTHGEEALQSVTLDSYDSFGRRVEDDNEHIMEFRRKYRFWRLGHHQGANAHSTGRSCADGGLPRSNLEEMQQANVKVQAQRSAWDTPPSEAAWRWRHSVAYWIAVCFIVGSLLFMLGSCASLYSTTLLNYQTKAVITAPYLIGSVFYTVGSYLGYVEVINVGREDDQSFIFYGMGADDTPMHSFYGYLVFLAGALLFNVCEGCAMGFPNVAPMALQNWPAVLGSVCFIAGSCIQVVYNGGICMGVDCTKVAWHVSVHNLVGSLAFMAAACCMVYDVAPVLDNDLVNWPYLIGSTAFFTGSSLQLWLWKDEQFGLAFASKLNNFEKQRFVAVSQSIDELHGFNRSPSLRTEALSRATSAPPGSALGSQSPLLSRSLSVPSHGAQSPILASRSPHPFSPAAHGDSQLDDTHTSVSGPEFVVINIACVGFTASIMSLVFSLAAVEDWPRRTLSASIVVLVFCGSLIITSIVHYAPTREPFDVLLWLLRIATVLLTAVELWTDVSWFQKLSESQ